MALRTVVKRTRRVNNGNLSEQVVGKHVTRTLHIPSSQVKMFEVGPRDGLQNEPDLVSVQDKVDLIKKLAKAGCSCLEAGSFVSPKWVPSMANSRQVMEELQVWKKENTTPQEPTPVLSCLVPNTTGLQHAIEVGVDEIAIFGSASETFSQKVGLSFRDTQSSFPNSHEKTDSQL